MALDSGKFTLQSKLDASRPLVFGRQTIRDFHGKGRWLTLPEVFIFSSNIGSGREADAVGIEGHRAFLQEDRPSRPYADGIAGSGAPR